MSTDNQVLRTVYLDTDVDDKLRQIAFYLGIKKGEIIRNILRKGLEEYHGQTFGGRLNDQH